MSAITAAGFQITQEPGRLYIERRPAKVQIDYTATRQADLGLYTPNALAVKARDEARAVVDQAIGRIAQEGDTLRHTEVRGNQVVGVIAARVAAVAGTQGDLEFKFCQAPEIAWSDGSVSFSYQRGGISIEVTPVPAHVDFLF